MPFDRKWAHAASLVAVVALALLFSCDGETVPTAPKAVLDVPAGCNPIAVDFPRQVIIDGKSVDGPKADCLLPYPSDFYLSNGRVSLPVEAQPKFGGAPIDVLAPHRPDGFSVGSPILVQFPNGVDKSNLVFHTDDVTKSLGDDSPTVVLDADTGERVLHFAEIDPRAETDDRRALIIRPLVRLDNAHRYVVAVRNLKDPGGAVILPPAAFKSLRDDHGKANPALVALSQHYEDDIFPVLDSAGITRDTLQLAWDFTTSSEENAIGDMRRIQEDAAMRLATAPPEVDIVEVKDNPAPHIGRRIEATVTVPLYVDSADPGSKLNHDGAGHVVAQGSAKVPFTVWIPTSVMNRAPGTPPARLLQYGHGFFGTRYEVEDFAIDFADEKGFVIVASDWWGLSAPDKLPVANLLVANPGDLPFITDRLQQAMANLMYAAAATKGPLVTMSPLQIQGVPAYDPTTLYFYGISLGHILGSTYVTLSPDVERASLSVGGYDFALMIFRSQAFIPLITLIALQVPDALDQQKLVTELQSTLDRIDPLSYAPHMLHDRLPASSPSLRIIMQTGLGDPAVPNLASFLQARVLGLGLLQPSPRDIAGLTDVPSPQKSGSTITLFDFGVTPSDTAVAPIQANPVHEGVRRSQGSMDQVDAFFKPNGEIVQACTDVCDPD